MCRWRTIEYLYWLSRYAPRDVINICWCIVLLHQRRLLACACRLRRTEEKLLPAKESPGTHVMTCRWRTIESLHWLRRYVPHEVINMQMYLSIKSNMTAGLCRFRGTKERSCYSSSGTNVPLKKILIIGMIKKICPFMTSSICICTFRQHQRWPLCFADSEERKINLDSQRSSGTHVLTCRWRTIGSSQWLRRYVPSWRNQYATIPPYDCWGAPIQKNEREALTSQRSPGTHAIGLIGE